MFRSGDFADALDYAAVVKRLQAFAADHPHKLMERFAQAIADVLIGEFGAPWVKVRVAKLAPIAGVKELGDRHRAQARAIAQRDASAAGTLAARRRRCRDQSGASRGAARRRQRERERRARPDLARHPDPAAVELDELARNREAESGALDFLRRAADLPEFLEHRRLILRARCRRRCR